MKRGIGILDIIVAVIVIGLLIQPEGRLVKRNLALAIIMIFGIWRTSYAPND